MVRRTRGASTRRLMRAVAATWVLAVVGPLVACTSQLSRAPREEPARRAPLVVFLVRHAEKVDASADPELSPPGAARAAALAAVLRDAGVERVHSTDFIRTRDTAAPLAAALGVEVEIYDPRELAAFIDRLEPSGGRHLVVGHSNTTPAAVELLGGEPGGEIDEASEYDRLYVVSIGGDGAVDTVLLRYGD